MIRFLLRVIVPLICFVAFSANAQSPSPAQMGITHSTVPEVLQVLDHTQTWVTIGNVDPTAHQFMLPIANGGTGTSSPNLTAGPGVSITGAWPNQTIGASSGPGGPGTPAGNVGDFQTNAGLGAFGNVPPPIPSSMGGEADIMVTDPSVGMAPATALAVTDNAPFIPALMNKMGPPSAIPLMGYDVTFPSIPGQQDTNYYFGSDFVLSRGARYRCSGAAGASSGGYAQVNLIFAPGVSGVIQGNSTWNPDNGSGGGTFENCGIYSLGFAEGTASGLSTGTPSANTQLTGISNFSVGGIASPPADVGDGVIVTPFLGRYYPWTTIPAVAPGAYIGAASGGNLTLAAPYVINPAFGAAQASFKQTGQANYANGDTITVGNYTYTAVTVLGATPGNFLIGSDWYVSNAHLAADINGTSCTGICVPPSVTPNVATTAPISAFMGFWSLVPGAAGNALPTAYTGVAGAWQGSPPTTFSGGTDSNNVAIYKLPASQKFMVQTTIGSNTAKVISGPRFMRPGDIVWSDAFPLFTTVLNVSPPFSFPQTLTMTSPFMNTFAVNATVTHAPGAEGQLWVMPAALKRETIAGSSTNAWMYWPIGLEMACSNAGSLNCTVSHDYNNTGYLNLFGRWVAGNTTGGSLSAGDSFGKNFIGDAMEGATVGSVYLDLHSESAENGEGPYNLIGNCVNPNNSVILGGYFGGTGAPMCAQQVGLLPPTVGNKFLFVTPQNTSPIGANVIGSSGFIGLWQNFSGMNGQDCVSLGRGAGGASPYGAPYTFAVSYAGCATGTYLGLNWNPAIGAWEWLTSSNGQMMRVIPPAGYTGYGGFGSSVQFPNGVLLAGDGNNANVANARLLGAANFKPAANWHLQGDTEINTVQTPGGQAAWYYAPQFSTTLTAAVAKGQPTSTPISVAACPTVTPPAGTLVSDQSASLSPNVNLCVFSSCAANQITCTAATLNASFAANDPIKLLYPYGSAPISNDPANPDYTATTLRSGSASNKDVGGRITLAAGTATYTLTGVYATAPVCFTADATTPANASSVSETTTVLTFTGTGTDVIKYHCIGRN